MWVWLKSLYSSPPREVLRLILFLGKAVEIAEALIKD
jgi:hypothetical protein